MSFVPPRGCRRRSLIRVRSIVLFAGRKDCVRRGLLFDTQKEGQCFVFALNVCRRVDHPMNEYLNHFVTARKY